MLVEVTGPCCYVLPQEPVSGLARLLGPSSLQRQCLRFCRCQKHQVSLKHGGPVAVVIRRAMQTALMVSYNTDRRHEEMIT